MRIQVAVMIDDGIDPMSSADWFEISYPIGTNYMGKNYWVIRTSNFNNN